MTQIRAWIARFCGLFGRQRRDQDLAAELETHVQMHMADNLRAGMTPEEARRQALLKLGGIEQTKENCRDQRGFPWLETLLQDIRFGLRMLRKNPGFTVVAILTLALGIGANATIFSVFNAVLLRHLPFTNASRLTLLGEAFPKAGLPPAGVSAPDLGVIERNQSSFEEIAVYGNREFGLSGNGEPERVMAARVSANLFPMLGVRPALGRDFSADEDAPGRDVAILSDSLWKSRYGGDPGIAGKVIELDRRPYMVVGVMPKGFEFPMRGPMMNSIPAQIWVPMAFTPTEIQGWGMMYNYSALARLRPGVSIQRARAEAAHLATIVQSHYPTAVVAAFAGSPLAIRVEPLREEVVGPTRALLIVLMGAVSLVLLIACVNVATLLISRAASRQKEVAVRAALGATRGRLLRQMLTESLLLATFGGALGFGIALFGQKLLLSLVPRTVSLPHNISAGGGVLVYVAAASILTAILFGLAPALQSWALSIYAGLQEGGRSSTHGHAWNRLQAFLVAAEFALALVVLIGAGLLVRSLAKLVETNPGFRPDHVLTLSVPLPYAAYPTAPEIRQLYQQLLDRIGNLPGVQSDGISNDLPLNVRDMEADQVDVKDNREGSAPSVVAAQTWISGSYFQTVGIPLMKGRWFTPEDRSSSQPVAVISEGMAKRFWPGQDAIGKRIRWGPPSTPWLTVVGIAGDVNDRPLSRPAQVHVYLPYWQVPDQLVADNVVGMWRSMNLAVRTQEDPSSITSAVLGQIHSLDADLAVDQVRTMMQVASESRSDSEFTTYLLGAFAGLALFLAAVGIYGVMAYMVSQQTHEIGIRLALGAQPRDLLALVLRRGAGLAAFGAAIGTVAALALTRLMTSLLYGVSATDPVTFAAVVVVLLTVALAACWIPARRAMRVDPMVALRYE